MATEQLREENLAMPYTMEDFERDYTIEHFSRLTLQEQREAVARLSPQQLREVLRGLPPEVRLAGLSDEQVRQLLDRMAAGRAAPPRKPRRRR